MRSRISQRKLIDVEEHLLNPSRRLYVLERLLSVASSAEMTVAERIIEPGPYDDDDRHADFLQGLSDMIGDVRHELQALSDFASYEPAEDPSEVERRAKELLAERGR